MISRHWTSCSCSTVLILIQATQLGSSSWLAAGRSIINCLGNPLLHVQLWTFIAHFECTHFMNSSTTWQAFLPAGSLLIKRLAAPGATPAGMGRVPGSEKCTFDLPQIIESWTLQVLPVDTGHYSFLLLHHHRIQSFPSLI